MILSLLFFFFCPLFMSHNWLANTVLKFLSDFYSGMAFCHVLDPETTLAAKQPTVHKQRAADVD